MTNFEKIKSMNKEQMVELFKDLTNSFEYCGIINDNIECELSKLSDKGLNPIEDYDQEKVCAKCVSEWLDKEWKE